MYSGSPEGLWGAGTPSGRFFSLRGRVLPGSRRPPAADTLWIRGATAHNLAGMDVPIPLARLTVRALAQAHTAVDPRHPTTTLVTTGPFRYSRNPIYLALTLLYLGVALLVNALWIVLLVVPSVLVIRYGVIAREEAYLTRMFGEAYRQYMRQVRRWL